MREIRAWREFDKYEVSSDGRVFSNDYNHTGKRKELRQYLDDDGYPYVQLVVNGRRYKRMVHRMVAESLIAKPSEKHQVNHKNGIRSDNNLSNLEWLTHRDNVIHGWRSNGRKQSIKQKEIRSRLSQGESNPKAKMTKIRVEELRELRNRGESLRNLSKMFDISISQVSSIALNKSWRDNHELTKRSVNPCNAHVAET